MQFTAPDIDAAVAQARAGGAGRLLGLPLYPLCGPSTTIPALEALGAAAARAGWPSRVDELTGWHRHPAYAPLWADAVRRLCRERRVDLTEPGTRLVFAAHGTPLGYLRRGSRYDLYVRDHSRAVAAALGVADYGLGFQNHDSRPGVEWTEPEIGRVVREPGVERVVVVPVSFMQEQSETLWDLDHELRDEAGAAGIELHRVPVPWDDPRFAALLADLVDPFVGGAPDSALTPCRCRKAAGAVCLNAPLESTPAGPPAGPPPPAGR